MLFGCWRLVCRLLLSHLLLSLFICAKCMFHRYLLCCTRFNFNTAHRINFDLRFDIFQLIQLIRIKFTLNIIFKFNGCLQYFDQLWNIDFEVLHGQDLVDVELGLPTEFLGNHLLHEPVFWEDFNILFFIFFQGPFQPREPPPCILEFRIRPSWLKDFLIWLKYKIRKPHFDIIYGILADGINCKAGIVQ